MTGIGKEIEDMELVFRPQGVCSQEMRVRLNEENVIEKLEVSGGCSGNLQGIAALVAGMSAEEAVGKLKGIRCGFKTTSCPDQLARGLEQALETKREK